MATRTDDYYHFTHKCEQGSIGHTYLLKSDVDKCDDIKPLLVQCRNCVKTDVVPASWVKQQPVEQLAPEGR